MEIKIFTKLKPAFDDFIKTKLFSRGKQMASNKFLENLSAEQKNLGSRIFDLVIGRVLKKAYLNLDEKGKENMEKVFLSDDDKEKENFVKKYMSNFKIVFEEEAQKIEEEIKAEIEKQV
jgi:predicted glycosyltransferase involved in capsule biosynthesis